MRSARGRRRLSEASPAFFDTYYCGMTAAPHRTAWLEAVVASFRGAQLTNEQQRILLLGPRKHGKTELMITLCVMLICMFRDIRILIITPNEGHAKKRLRRIRKLLETERIKADWCSDPEAGYGPLRHEKLTERNWGATSIEVVRDSIHVEPTIEVMGAGGEPTGGHYDVILFDDVETPKRVNTSALRQATWDWYEGTVVALLEICGLMFAIGTRKHFHDLYSRWIDGTDWDVIEDSAIQEMPSKIKPIYEVSPTGRKRLVRFELSDDYKVLWDEGRPIQWLLRIKYAIDDHTFAREFQNEVQDAKNAQIKLPWIRAAQTRGAQYSLYVGAGEEGAPEWPDDLVVIQAWDLSLVDDPVHAKEADTDFAVGLTVGWQPSTELRWLMGFVRERGLDPEELEAAISDEHDQWPARTTDGLAPFVRAVVVERNSFGAIHTWGLIKRTRLPIVPHHTGRNKADPYRGLPVVRHAWQHHGWVLPSRTAEDRDALRPFVTEHHRFGLEKHDDCFLADWIFESGLMAIAHNWEQDQRRTARLAVRRARRKAQAERRVRP